MGANASQVDCAQWRPFHRVSTVSHKSGTYLADSLVKAASEICRHKVADGHLAYVPGTRLPNGPRRAIHFVRDPFMLAASALVYHRKGVEFWQRTPFNELQQLTGPDAMAFNHLDGVLQAAAMGLLPPVHLDETYAQYLHRLDDATAMHAEMARTYGGGLAELEVTMDHNPKTDTENAFVCLDQLMALANHEYAAALNELLRFWGAPKVHSWPMAREMTRSLREGSSGTHSTGSVIA